MCRLVILALGKIESSRLNSDAGHILGQAGLHLPSYLKTRERGRDRDTQREGDRYIE